jgi:hypothetical protein
VSKFIVVRGKADRMASVERYLYEGQSVVTAPITGTFGTFVIVDTGTDESYRSEYILGRLQSGFGAKMFDTREEADAYIAAEKD